MGRTFRGSGTSACGVALRSRTRGERCRNDSSRIPYPVLCTFRPEEVFMQPRTYVASNGLDTNDGRLATPCRSIGAALAQTDPGGEIIVLDSAGYGTVVINKSVSVIAPPGIYAGITVTAGTGIDVTAGVVALRGLTIRGPGGMVGIHVGNATVRIDRCVISGLGQYRHPCRHAARRGPRTRHAGRAVRRGPAVRRRDPVLARTRAHRGERQRRAERAERRVGQRARPRERAQRQLRGRRLDQQGRRRVLPGARRRRDRGQRRGWDQRGHSRARRGQASSSR